MKIKPEEITSVIRTEIERFDKKVETVDSGTVVQVGDGIARVYGLDECMQGELLELGKGIRAMALNLEYDNVGAVILGDSDEVMEGDMVKRTGKVVEIPVSDNVIGRVVDALGEPIDGQGPIEATTTRPPASSGSVSPLTSPWRPASKLSTPWSPSDAVSVSSSLVTARPERLRSPSIPF